MDSDDDNGILVVVDESDEDEETDIVDTSKYKVIKCLLTGTNIEPIIDKVDGRYITDPVYVPSAGDVYLDHESLGPPIANIAKTKKKVTFSPSTNDSCPKSTTNKLLPNKSTCTTNIQSNKSNIKSIIKNTTRDTNNTGTSKDMTSKFINTHIRGIFDIYDIPTRSDIDDFVMIDDTDSGYDPPKKSLIDTITDITSLLFTMPAIDYNFE